MTAKAPIYSDALRRKGSSPGDSGGSNPPNPPGGGGGGDTTPPVGGGGGGVTPDRLRNPRRRAPRDDSGSAATMGNAAAISPWANILASVTAPTQQAGQLGMPGGALPMQFSNMATSQFARPYNYAMTGNYPKY